MEVRNSQVLDFFLNFKQQKYFSDFCFRAASSRSCSLSLLCLEEFLFFSQKAAEKLSTHDDAARGVLRVYITWLLLLFDDKKEEKKVEKK